MPTDHQKNGMPVMAQRAAFLITASVDVSYTRSDEDAKKQNKEKPSTSPAAAYTWTHTATFYSVFLLE